MLSTCPCSLSRPLSTPAATSLVSLIPYRTGQVQWRGLYLVCSCLASQKRKHKGNKQGSPHKPLNAQNNCLIENTATFSFGRSSVNRRVARPVPPARPSPWSREIGRAHV